MKKTEYFSLEIVENGEQIRIARNEKGIKSKALKQYWDRFDKTGVLSAVRQVNQVISCAMKRLADAPCGERVQKTLTQSGAFKNPAFGTFMIHLFNACKIVYQDYDDYESGIPNAINMARLLFHTLPYNEVSKRKEVEELILSNIDLDLFIGVFAEAVPEVLTPSQLIKTDRPS